MLARQEETVRGLGGARDASDGALRGPFPHDDLLDSTRYSSEHLQAKAIVDGYLNDTIERWHHIDNAHNDLLREIIKQLVFKLDAQREG